MSKQDTIIRISVIVATAVLALVFFWSKSQKAAKSKVTWENPNDILFSMPTFCDLAPAMEGHPSSPGRDDFVQHEDYWRQIEFVPMQDSNAVAKLVEEVRQFESSNRVNLEKDKMIAWKNAYARKEFPTPIGTIGLSYRKLLDSFPALSEAQAVFLTTGGSAAKVRGGFSFKVSSLGTIYGQHNQDAIMELAFEPSRKDSIAEPALAMLSNYCAQNGLLMADWYRISLVNFKDAPPSWGSANAK